jgi:hypothetical protein
MKLTAYVVDGHKVDIRPAPVERDWMDATHERFAQRCLPLTIANAFGWEILCPTGFAARWNGGNGLDAIAIRPDDGTRPPVVSHFGHGVLTFHVPCLFRTEPGFDLVVQGPVNRPKDALAPLSGVIETDWAPYGFTMNWLFTRPGVAIRFEPGEPYCHIMLVRRGELEAVEPELRLLSENPDLKQQHEAWAASRLNFNADLKRPGSEARAEKWQKLYHRGLAPDGAASTTGHRTRVRLRPFRRDEPS